MKRVTGYISVRPLGDYDFDFYVEDSATDEEIREKIDEVVQLSIDYKVEEGYIAEQKTVYRKKYPWEEN